MKQAAKNQVVCYVDLAVYFKLIEAASKRGFKTLSIAVNECLKEYFSQEQSQELAIDRLNKTLQQRDNTIMQLQSELHHKVLSSTGNKGGSV